MTVTSNLDTPTGVVPYLAVRDGDAALAWYAEALGAEEFGKRYVGADGQIGHAAMRVHGAVFYLCDGAPDLGVVAGDVDAPVHTSLVLTVPDADRATDRAVEAGARLERPPGDNPYGRVAVVRDPFGHRWLLEGPVVAQHPTGTESTRVGDLAHLALWTPDAATAATFYSAVLGWRVGPGSADQGRRVESQSIGIGIWGGQEHRTVFCCWQVDEVDAAFDRVRAAGGTAEQPHDEPYGRIADCVDDQGVPFALYAPRPEMAAGPRVPLNGQRQGDVSYLVLSAPDGARTRAFYGAVLGWPTGPGAEPEAVHPMVGIPDTGEARVVPMWKVDDVAAAVERVRAAGGRAEEPERKPYGIAATCTDDQGMPFYLGDT